MSIEIATMILTTITFVVALITLPVWLSTPTLSQPPTPTTMSTRDWVDLLLAQQPTPPPPLTTPSPTVPGIRDRIRLVSAELADTQVHLGVYLDDITAVDAPDTWDEDTIPEVFYPSGTRVGH